jgi:hypothetical protein
LDRARQLHAAHVPFSVWYALMKQEDLWRWWGRWMQCSRLCFSHTACDTNQDGKRTALEWLYIYIQLSIHM